MKLLTAIIFACVAAFALLHSVYSSPVPSPMPEPSAEANPNPAQEPKPEANPEPAPEAKVEPNPLVVDPNGPGLKPTKVPPGSIIAPKPPARQGLPNLSNLVLPLPNIDPLALGTAPAPNALDMLDARTLDDVVPETPGDGGLVV